MLCSNCGEDIPFTGKECPHCHADKSQDQQSMTIAMLVALITAGVGYLIGGFAYGIGGLLIGGIVGGVITALWKPQAAQPTRKRRRRN